VSLLESGSPVTLAAFVLEALVVLGSAIAVVTRRSAVSTIAWLVVHFVATACVYVLLNSQFIAAVQVLVYAGAIMVLFLFVIMLLQVDREVEPTPAAGVGRKVLIATLLLALFTIVGSVAARLPGRAASRAASAAPAAEDTVEWLAEELVGRHVVAFEVASVVLIAAMAGVMVYTTRRVAVAKGARR
jgi:NADH-quinone oxidoreductase subunit J